MPLWLRLRSPGAIMGQLLDHINQKHLLQRRTVSRAARSHTMQRPRLGRKTRQHPQPAKAVSDAEKLQREWKRPFAVNRNSTIPLSEHWKRRSGEQRYRRGAPRREAPSSHSALRAAGQRQKVNLPLKRRNIRAKKDDRPRGGPRTSESNFGVIRGEQSAKSGDYRALRQKTHERRFILGIHIEQRALLYRGEGSGLELVENGRISPDSQPGSYAQRRRAQIEEIA